MLCASVDPVHDNCPLKYLVAGFVHCWHVSHWASTTRSMRQRGGVGVGLCAVDHCPYLLTRPKCCYARARVVNLVICMYDGRSRGCSVVLPLVGCL